MFEARSEDGGRSGVGAALFTPASLAFPNHRTTLDMGRRLVDFYADPSPLWLPAITLAEMRGRVLASDRVCDFPERGVTTGIGASRGLRAAPR